MFEQGLAIGNGLTNPAIQYKAYPDYALEMGIIKKATRNLLNLVLVPACESAIKLCGNIHFSLFSFQQMLDFLSRLNVWNEGYNGLKTTKCLNLFYI